MKTFLTRTVIVLSFVSLFTDISSEMLYPVLPVYLSSIGFSALYIGILEGFAEAMVGISKGYFGKLSDLKGNRHSFVRWGYSLSAVSKPMMAIFTFPLWIFTARTLDRLGKGIRTNARDAWLADESGLENRGKVFGFHRAMDTVGAAIGPILAITYLHFYPGEYRNLFFIAFIPGFISVMLTWNTGKEQVEPKPEVKTGFLSYFSYWKKSSASYKKIIIAFLLFALFNSSDAFIILIGKQNSLSDSQVIIAYVCYNLFYALLAFPFGRLADHIGMKKVFILGIILFAVSYGLFPNMPTLPLFIMAFGIYGLYAAATEGVSKAWISRLCAPDEKATALGFYSGFQSLIVLSANILAGVIWVKFSPQTLFYVSATGAVMVVLYLLAISDGLKNIRALKGISV